MRTVSPGPGLAWIWIHVLPRTASESNLSLMDSYSKATPDRLGIHPHLRAIHVSPEPNQGLRTVRLVRLLNLAYSSPSLTE